MKQLSQMVARKEIYLLVMAIVALAAVFLMVSVRSCGCEEWCTPKEEVSGV